MSSSFTSTASRQIGVGVVLVSAVTLITFVFSFLGTILAGAVVGMMVGYSPRWRWQHLLISLVFPVAQLASMHVSKSAQDVGRSLPLALVCFGAFWGTFLLTRGLSFLERREAPVPAAAPAAPGRVGPSGLPPCGTTSEGAPGAPTACVEPELEELEGTWSLVTTAPDGHARCKVIEIAHGELALSFVETDGRAELVAKGGVTLQRLGAFKLLRLSPSPPVDPTAAPPWNGFPGTWIYRVGCGHLTLAADLEATARGREPSLETYARACPRVAG